MNLHCCTDGSYAKGNLCFQGTYDIIRLLSHKSVLFVLNMCSGQTIIDVRFRNRLKSLQILLYMLQKETHLPNYEIPSLIRPHSALNDTWCLRCLTSRTLAFLLLSLHKLNTLPSIGKDEKSTFRLQHSRLRFNFLLHSVWSDLGMSSLTSQLHQESCSHFSVLQRYLNAWSGVHHHAWQQWPPAWNTHRWWNAWQ